MTNKINNQERIKKVAIIPNNNFYKLDPFIKSCDSTHKDTMIEFIYETGIELPIENIYCTSSQELAYGLVCQGFIILLSTSTNSTTSLNIYLPEQLTDEQKQYLKFATSLLSNYTLMVFSLNSKEEVFCYKKEASSNPENFINYVNGFPTYDNQQQTNNNKLVRKPE